MATKRSHDDSIMEAPDAKRAALSVTTSDVTMNAPPPREPVPSRSAPSLETNGIRRLVSTGFSTPSPVHPDVFLVVESAGFEEYFGTLWDTLIHLVYPDFDPENIGPAPITRNNFILVCRRILKSRVDHVYTCASGRRPAHRIPLAADLMIPAALAHVINGIGVFTVNGIALTVVPAPEAAPAEAADRLENLVTSVMQVAFSNLVKAAVRRGLINPGYTSRAQDGTSYWLLASRNGAMNNDQADFLDDVVVIRSVFPEWKPTDSLLAAVVCRPYTGHFGDIVADMYTSEPIRNVVRLRDDFNGLA